jgi:hypothetical protein
MRVRMRVIEGKCKVVDLRVTVVGEVKKLRVSSRVEGKHES